MKIVKIAVFLLLILKTISAQLPIDDFNKKLDKALAFQNIDSDSILYYAESAYDIAIDIKNPEFQIDALKQIIKTQIKIGSYSKAIRNCLKADSIILFNDSKSRKAEILMYKGVVYESSGLGSEGLKYLFMANKLIDETQDFEYAPELDYYIAATYYEIGELENCRLYAKKAIHGESKNRDSSNMIKSVALISSSFRNADSVYKYLKIQDELTQSDPSDYKRSVFLNNKALYYKAVNNMDIAAKSYREAIDIATKNAFKMDLSVVLNNYAYLLMAEGKYDSANLTLAHALSITRELENIDLEATVLDSYSDYFEKTGDAAQSLKYYRKSVKLRNKYKRQQQIEKSLFLSTVFETEKKESEIARQNAKLYQTNAGLFAVIALFFASLGVVVYFRQKSATRKAKIKSIEHEKKLDVANALIEGQDAERKRIAMDLHDGISPKIGSLKLMIGDNFNKSKDYPEVNAMIDDIGNNIREISHRMLPSQLESKGLVVCLMNFIQSLKQTNHIDIDFQTNLQYRLPVKFEINIFFLFYELINNSLKHAFATELFVQLLSDDKVISISVEDNGVGFDPNLDCDGIGIKNSRQRVTYLNGEIDIDSVIGQGTAVLIEIKLQQK